MGYAPRLSNSKQPPMKVRPTDVRLLDTAVEHFGRLGLKGASTRLIAAEASVPMSLITYHFGGKDQLYLAAAEHIATSMREWMRPALDRADAIAADQGSAEASRRALHIICERFIEILMNKETEALARFIVREQADPSEAFSLIYESAMGVTISRVADPIAAAVASPMDPQEARLRSVALLGQMLVFRVSKATALAANQWTSFSAEHVAMIKRIVADHLDAIVDAIAKPSSGERG